MARKEQKQLLNVKIVKSENGEDKNGGNGWSVHNTLTQRSDNQSAAIFYRTLIIIIINLVRISTIYGHQTENYVFDCARAIRKHW